MTQAAIVALIGGVGLIGWGVVVRYGRQIKSALIFGAGAVVLAAGLLYLIVRVGTVVFSVEGFLWSFGLGNPVEFAAVVRGVWWLIVVELGVITSLVADKRAGDDRGWFVAHWTALRRLGIGLVACVLLVAYAAPRRGLRPSFDVELREAEALEDKAA